MFSSNQFPMWLHLLWKGRFDLYPDESGKLLVWGGLNAFRIRCSFKHFVVFPPTPFFRKVSNWEYHKMISRSSFLLLAKPLKKMGVSESRKEKGKQWLNYIVALPWSAYRFGLCIPDFQVKMFSSQFYREHWGPGSIRGFFNGTALMMWFKKIPWY